MESRCVRFNNWLSGHCPMSSAEQVAKLARSGGLSIGLAESCTGGLIAASISEVPGCSVYFRGGVVAYDNQVKQDLLGVPELLLLQFGAVSEEVARAMAEGARRVLRCDLALSVTGIAGPEGGTAEKPVGTVFVALADDIGCQVRRFRFEGGRNEVRRATLQAALEWLEMRLKYA